MFFFLSRPRIIRIHLPIRLIRVLPLRFILSRRSFLASKLRKFPDFRCFYPP